MQQEQVEAVRHSRAVFSRCHPTLRVPPLSPFGFLCSHAVVCAAGEQGVLFVLLTASPRSQHTVFVEE